MAGKTVFRLVQVLMVLAAALVLSTCGGKSKGNATSVPQINAAQTDAQIPIEIPLDETLAELEGMECPEGVDEALWAELKDALGKALSCRARTCGAPLGENAKMVDGGAQVPALQGVIKFVATPPTGEANRVNDLSILDNGDGTFTLSWHYKNLGDYDQDGTVGISDITPLAQHYNESYEPTDVNCLLAVIDGSGNGTVDIADITPIAIHFAENVHHYDIEGALAEEGPWEAISEVAQEAGAGDNRIAYEAMLSEAPLPFYHVVPVDNEGSRGEASNVVLRQSLEPIIYSVSPTVGYSEAECTFSALVTGSEPLEYAWDFGGGAQPNASDAAFPTVVLGSVGTYPASLTMSNIAGDDTYEFTLTVTDSGGAWRMSGHDRRRTRKSEFLGPQAPGLKWRYHLWQRSYAEPVINSEGAIFLGTNEMGLVALKPEGTHFWRFEASEDIDDSAAIASDGTVYAGCSDGSLRAFTPGGELLWELPLSAYCSRDPAIAEDGTIIIAAANGEICAVSPEGEPEWSFTADDYVTSNPAIADDGTVYFGCHDDRLYAVNPNGSFKWRLEGMDPVRPVIGRDGTIYTGYNVVCAINPDATLKWQKDLEFSGYFVAIDDERALYLFGRMSGVLSLHAFDFDGNELWSYDEAPVNSFPVTGADGTIYIGADDNRLLALNPNGTLKWEYQIAPAGIERSFKPSAIGADGTLYAIDGEYVYAFGNEPPPEAEWTHTFTGASGDDMVTDDEGAIYVAGENWTTETGSRITLLKYNRDGYLQFCKAWDGPDEENASDIALGPNGDIYIAGDTKSFGAGTNNALTLKYDSQGTLQWARTWGAEFIDRAKCVAVDTSGNVYVTGERSDQAFSPWKLFLLKYDPDGNLLFAESWNTYYSNFVHDILVGQDGDVHVLDNISIIDSVEPDRGLLLDFAPDGALLRSRSFTCSIGEEYYNASTAAALDSSGNLYVAGYGGTFIKFNAAGEPVAASRYDVLLRSVCAGSDGRIHLTGNSDYFSSSSDDLLYMTCAPDGTILEQKLWSESGSNEGRCITVDSQGNVYLGGRAVTYCGYWFDIDCTTTFPTVEVESIESTMIDLELTETSPEGTQRDIIGSVDLIPEDDDDTQFVLIANPPT